MSQNQKAKSPKQQRGKGEQIQHEKFVEENSSSNNLSKSTRISTKERREEEQKETIQTSYTTSKGVILSAKGPSSNESSEITEQTTKLSSENNTNPKTPVTKSQFDLNVQTENKKRYSTGYIKHKPNKS